MPRFLLFSVFTLAALGLAFVAPNALAELPNVDLTKYQQLRYVSASTGSDATGTGTAENPWQSLTQALQEISDVTLTNRYAVLIAAGLYKRPNGETPFFMEPWMDLYGGFSPADWNIRGVTGQESILDGETKRRVIVPANDTTLDGMTIQNGYARTGGGGGVSFVYVDSATLSNCAISGCQAVNGGGVDCYYSSPRIQSCRIEGNRARSGGGLSVGFDAAPLILNCTISGNTSRYGGGVFCEKRSRPHFAHSMITENVSTWEGGGTSCYDGSSPTFSDCVISGNSAPLGGGAYGRSSVTTFARCDFVGNQASASGGGLRFDYSLYPKLTDCLIFQNTARDGGGLMCVNDSSPMLSRCSILANIGGGIECVDASPVLNDCVISGNSDGFGGGMYCCCGSSPSIIRSTINGNTRALYCESGSTPELTNCTISWNSAGLYCSDSSPMLVNCIMWNVGTEVKISSGNPKVTYSSIRGGYPGTGNIQAYPMFVAPSNGDFRLQDHSPCIDRGVDVGLPYNGVAPDMGAWESPDGYTSGPIPPPRVWYVRGGAPSDGNGQDWLNAFQTVAMALAVASISDEIWVAEGVYAESVVIGLGVKLIGGFSGSEVTRSERDWQAHPTILDASGLNRPVITAQNASGMVIDGLTIRGGKAGWGGGLYLEKVNSSTITHCTIYGNSASFGGALYCLSSSPRLMNCTLSGNDAKNGIGGLHCSLTSPTLINCILWNFGNEIFVDSGGPTVTFSSVQGGHPGEGNIAAYPMFVDPSHGNFRLKDRSPCIDQGTISDLPFNGAAPDMGAWESPSGYTAGPPLQRTVWYVRSAASTGGDGRSWFTAFQTVNAALAIVAASDEVWVAEGVYPESIALESNMKLFGGFAGNESAGVERNSEMHPTILDAAGLEWRVITAQSVSKITIDGFTIRGGLVTYYPGGGGVYLATVDSVTLSNCTISANKAPGGGGMECHNANVVVNHCRIANNLSTSYGGGVQCQDTSLTLLESTISDNTAKGDGGGMNCSYSSVNLANCSICRNSGGTSSTGDVKGGGIKCYNSSAIMNSCLIYNNSISYSGGGVYCDSSVVQMTNCVVLNNMAQGVILVSSPSVLANNTICGNREGLSCSSSSPIVTNCILWNRKEEITDYRGTPIVSYCSIEYPGFPGVGNISSDPLFVDATNGDYRLLPNSPCIDSGTKTEFLTTDLDGNPRPVDIPGVGHAGVFANDMGCYELQLSEYPTPTPTITPTPTPFTPSDFNIDNTVNAADLIRFLRAWHSEIQTASPEDLHDDGLMDLMDLAIFQQHWGETTGVQ